MTDRFTSCPDAAEFASYMMGMLSDETRERIDRHLARCERCREHVAAVVRLKSDPAATPADVAFPRAWARVEEQLEAWSKPSTTHAEQGAGAPNVITLLPRPHHRPSITVDRLAATTAVVPGAEPVSFFSADGTVVAKLTRGDNEGYEVYLVSDDPERAQGVLTRLVSSSGELIVEGISDELGVLTLPVLSGLDPSAARVELILPHATVLLEPAVWRDRLIAAGSAELHSMEGHTLRLEVIERQVRREYRIDFSGLRSGQPACSLRVYATHEGRSTEIPIGPEGTAILQESSAAPAATLRAYVVGP